MKRPSECAKCGGRMSEGFMLDNAHGTRKVASWVRGAPRKSLWMGLSLKGTKPVEIATWRCDRCGYLESYAPG